MDSFDRLFGVFITCNVSFASLVTPSIAASAPHISCMTSNGKKSHSEFRYHITLADSFVIVTVSLFDFTLDDIFFKPPCLLVSIQQGLLMRAGIFFLCVSQSI